MGEIGAQIIDLATTVDTIHGTHQAKENSRLDNLSDTAYDNIYQALSETKDNVTERDVQNYLFQQRLQDHTNQSDFGTGGKYTRAIQAVTAFTQGIMGNNIVTAIANGSAPYLANEVKNQIQGNSVESDIQRTVAHGLVNAGLALAKGENAAAQAAGAMTGETMGILSHSLYGKTPEELTETEKQNISAWATLASGIVGGLISDNSAGVANAAQAGKVVVENNFFSPNDLPTGMADYGQSVSSLAISMAQNDGSLEEINAALTKAVKGTHPEGQDPALGILIAWGNLTGIPLDVFLTQQEMTPEKAAEILSSTPPTTEAKALQFVAAKAYLDFAKSGKEISSWDAGTGQYSFKDTGKVIDVKHPNGQFDGSSLPNSYDTVWGSIKATQPNYSGSVIPKSFEMTLPNGQKVWVHGNATEHIAEYAQYRAKNYTPEAVRLSSQQQLNSLQGALNLATQKGLEYNKLINIGGWELKLSPPREKGGLPAVIHAIPIE
ncbi:VENN motif pre-toxin domain-containing protein [Proteus cibi]|uniref:VENN motif pre-toxin domain-containing protein n=1 Tax=Proteus cibi TaxID=2050966 RepID=UPI0032DAA3F0